MPARSIAQAALAVACLVPLLPPVFAHETWIASAPAGDDRAGSIVVAITNGTRFPEHESGLARSSLSKSGVISRGDMRPLTAVAELPRTLVARAPADWPGIATIWLSLDAQPITLDEALVQAYFEEIQADPWIRATWADERARGWHERYAKFAKHIVRVGPADTTDDGWRRPVGGEFEVVPERDPTALRAGDDLPVRLLLHGAPLAGQMIALTDGATKTWRRTDAEGRASFVLTGEGPWLVHGTVLRHTEVGWLSWFTTLTFRSAPGNGATAIPPAR